MRIAVFGSSGMLGRAVVNVLKQSTHEVVAIGRTNADQNFTVGKDSLRNLDLDGVDYVINCIGLISHLIEETDVNSRLQAASLNALFPHELASHSQAKGFRVIQIATDCVFSGKTGSYLESSPHDAADVYGITKSLGEVVSENVMNLRASIIGREERGYKSLLEWVLCQPLDAEISGYTDRLWNGVTTQAFARIVLGVVSQELFIPGVQHVIPQDKVTKAELVQLIAQAYGRSDIKIENQSSGIPKDMTLSTEYPQVNSELWRAAGYKSIPTISQMIDEMAG